MAIITLMQFREDLIEKVDEFIAHYQEGIDTDPGKWPAALDEVEWHDQFAAFLGHD